MNQCHLVNFCNITVRFSTNGGLTIIFAFFQKTLVMANRIFETCLYNYFLAKKKAQSSEIFCTAAQNKPMFIQNNRLNMELIFKKFVEYFGQIYEDKAEVFDEEEGRSSFQNIWIISS